MPDQPDIRVVRLKGVRVEGASAYLTFAEEGERDMTFTIVGAEKPPARWTQSDFEAAAARIAEQHTYNYDGSDVTVLPLPVSKLVIVDRMTDAELAAALAFFANGTARARRARERWLAASEVNPANEDTIGLFQALYGAERTAELLAPE
jgi:hypothetical protein